MRNKILILIAVAVLLLLPGKTRAAVLSLEPAENAYGPGNQFAIDVKIDINSACINTVEAEIDFPRTKLILTDFLVGDSILTVWVDRPAKADMDSINQAGVLHFSGGIPGGYCGKIPGDPGQSNVLGRLLFQVPRFTVAEDDSNTAIIRFGDMTRALVNDGQGTQDILITKAAQVAINRTAVKDTVDWQQEIKIDNIPPEPFTIELRQDPKIYDGKYHILFNTVDKQSGIDRYEVLEIRPEQSLGAKPKQTWWDRLVGAEKPAPVWQTAEMPYILRDQTLKSVIRVRAVDKAGNERMVEYVPPLDQQQTEQLPIGRLVVIGSVFGVVVALLIILIILLIRKFIIKKSNYEEDIQP